MQYDTTGELLNTISTGSINVPLRGPQPVDVVLGGPDNTTTANIPVPEPSSVLGIMGFSGLFAGSVLRRRINNRK